MDGVCAFCGILFYLLNPVSICDLFLQFDMMLFISQLFGGEGGGNLF